MSKSITVDPWRIGTEPGDDGLVIRNPLGEQVGIKATPGKARAAVKAHEQWRLATAAPKIAPDG